MPKPAQRHQTLARPAPPPRPQIPARRCQLARPSFLASSCHPSPIPPTTYRSVAHFCVNSIRDGSSNRQLFCAFHDCLQGRVRSPLEGRPIGSPATTGSEYGELISRPLFRILAIIMPSLSRRGGQFDILTTLCYKPFACCMRDRTICAEPTVSKWESSPNLQLRGFETLWLHGTVGAPTTTARYHRALFFFCLKSRRSRRRMYR